MLTKKFATVLLALSVAGLIGSGTATGQSSRSNRSESSGPQPKTLLDHLDHLGASIFGKVLPQKKPKHVPQPSREHARQHPGNDFPLPPWNTSSARTGVTRAVNPGGGKPNAIAAPPSAPKESRNDLEGRPLHERLEVLRESPFSDSPASTAKAPAGPSAGRVAAARPASARQPAASALPPIHEPVEEPLPIIVGRPTPAAAPAAARVTVPVVAPVGVPVAAPAVIPAAKVEQESVPAAVEPARPTRPPAAAADRGVPPVAKRGAVLVEGRAPALSVQTTGPRKISLGKESKYELTVQNLSDVPADDVVVMVDIPAWADLLGAEATAGTTQPPAGDRSFEWHVGQLAAGGRQRLDLRIIPRQSRPFDLAVRWQSKPVASQVMIEVQEPKLSLDLKGPRDVLYGSPELYKLTVTNTGTGDAENAVIHLMPTGSGGTSPISHALGNLGPGEAKSIEVELTARQVGDLAIQVDVEAEGGIRAQLAEQVIVRRADLAMEVAGPKVQFVGAVAEYQIRLANRGTAPATNVSLSAQLPAGAKYLSGIDDARFDEQGGKLLWTLKALEPNTEKLYAVKCTLAAGVARVDVASTADNDVAANGSATTQVEAIADLCLEVKDPTGPVPTGKDAAYVLHVRNRGTKTAPNVEVVVYFSQGIEPVAAEGGPHQLGPGHVVFEPIPAMAPGSEKSLTVRARAEKPGNHVFRAEVHSKPLGTRLVSEETTHFYQEGDPSHVVPTSNQAETPAAMPSPQPLRPLKQFEPLVAPGSSAAETSATGSTLLPTPAGAK
jgi:uncharacterized repeat protein (TIGR01451 family)